MQYDDALRLLPVESADSNEFTFTCPNCLGAATCYRGLDDEAVLSCLGECSEQEIIGKEVVDEKPALEASPGADAAKREMLDGNGVSPYTNGLAPNVFQWKMMLYELGKRGLDDLIKERPEHRAVIQTAPLEGFVEQVNRLRNDPKLPMTGDPHLDRDEINKEIYEIAVALQKHYLPAKATVESERALSIVVENAERAILSNAEYLSREALLSQLYYTHHASLHVGGKHEGKTTAVKTEALAFAVGGRQLYGRDMVQCPVIYAASEDEYPSVRMDLLKMGWNPSVPLQMVRIADNADRDFVLEDIAKIALQSGAYFIVLDMLFDFTAIQDELKYGHTREKTGKVIQLATAIKGHVKATHHSPKWMPDAATAAKAALGSQGIAARFSPILLSRQWTKGLYTIESTMTRDPRGKALDLTCVDRQEDGWLVAKGEFKSWMKWKIYFQRILDYFEMQEPGARKGVTAVSNDLEIPRPEAQNALMRMAQGEDAVLERQRSKANGPYTYALVGANSLDRIAKELSERPN